MCNKNKISNINQTQAPKDPIKISGSLSIPNTAGSRHHLRNKVSRAEADKLTPEREERPTCGEHDGWITVVGAAGDRGHDHRPVRQLVLTSFVMNRDVILLLLSCNLEAFKAHLHKRAQKYKHSG